MRFGTDKKTDKLGEDVTISGLFSVSPPPGRENNNNNNTPVEMRYKGPEDASYTAEEVKPKYSSYGNCVFLSFELVLKNIWQVGTWKVSAVYPPLDIDRSTNFEVVAGEGGGGDKIDTWINSVRTPAGKNIPNGGSTTSKVVTVDFQGTVSGPGSEIDLKLDNKKWVPVASPKTIPGLSVGKHTIYLRAVDQDSWIYSAITGIYTGLLVHVIHLIDSDNKIVKLIIDAGDGKILSKTVWSVKDAETAQGAKVVIYYEDKHGEEYHVVKR